jgi:hypothetical protein
MATEKNAEIFVKSFFLYWLWSTLCNKNFICRFQEAMKFLSLLNSFVELDTNRLLKKLDTPLSMSAKRLLLTKLFVIILEFDVKLFYNKNSAKSESAEFYIP